MNIKGYTYAEVARITNRDPRTVQKYADIEDLKKKKKFRRTAKRIWEILMEQHDFKGSDRTVRAYVSRRKKELLEEFNGNNDAALLLEASPGDAQVDFFKVKGEVVELPYLVMSFLYSNEFLVQVFESQNQDSFLEGMKRFFHHIGGVPRGIRFDNLSPAVKKILPHGKCE